jgi:hypothetical protein
MMPLDLRKGSGGQGYCPYSALIHSGATYNCISQSVADKLGLEGVKAGRKKNRKKMPPPITMVNSEPLRATTVVRRMVQMRNDA